MLKTATRQTGYKEKTINTLLFGSQTGAFDV